MRPPPEEGAPPARETEPARDGTNREDGAPPAERGDEAQDPTEPAEWHSEREGLLIVNYTDPSRFDTEHANHGALPFQFRAKAVGSNRGPAELAFNTRHGYSAAVSANLFTVNGFDVRAAGSFFTGAETMIKVVPPPGFPNMVNWIDWNKGGWHRVPLATPLFEFVQSPPTLSQVKGWFNPLNWQVKEFGVGVKLFGAAGAPVLGSPLLYFVPGRLVPEIGLFVVKWKRPEGGWNAGWWRPTDMTFSAEMAFSVGPLVWSPSDLGVTWVPMGILPKKYLIEKHVPLASAVSTGVDLENGRRDSNELRRRRPARADT